MALLFHDVSVCCIIGLFCAECKIVNAGILGELWIFGAVSRYSLYLRGVVANRCSSFAPAALWVHFAAAGLGLSRFSNTPPNSARRQLRLRYQESSLRTVANS